MPHFQCKTCRRALDGTVKHWHLKMDGTRLYKTCRDCRRNNLIRQGRPLSQRPEQSTSDARFTAEVRECEYRIRLLAREYLAVRQGPHAVWRDAHDRLAAALQGHPRPGHAVIAEERQWWYSRASNSVMSMPIARD